MEELIKPKGYRSILNLKDTQIAIKATKDYFETNLNSGNVVIACSDGLHNLLSDAEIARVISDDEENPAIKLISLANERGGNDNITVVAVKIT